MGQFPFAAADHSPWPGPLPACVLSDGQITTAWPGACALLSGSFNPAHEAHWQLACIAETILKVPVAFELTILNADKGMIPGIEVQRRLAQFHTRAAVWLTEAPRFEEKARHFPEAWFVVGADTAARLLAPRYYAGAEAGLLDALARLRDQRCRFLVACRADQSGRCLTLADLPVPADFADLFAAISPEAFRRDLSSTDLRAGSSKD